MDEPFGALDPLTRDRLQQSFLAIARRLALTVVFVTHDVLEAFVIADRIAVLRDGRIEQVGAPAELLNAPATAYVHALLTTPLRHVEALRVLAAAGGAAPSVTP
jgi:osmoprotectant transport system ATP-binding protein